MSLPTEAQWKKIGTALAFSFVSTFLAVLLAGGGIQNTFEATFALASSALVAGINATLYTLVKLFEDGE